MAEKKDVFAAHGDASSEERAFHEDVDAVNLHNNLQAKIQNPLAHLSPQTLMRDVEEFARENSLEDISPLLKKGALVARDPANFENVEGLDDAEREALRNEIAHKWRQPRTLYFTVILCSIGAAVQGWDQTGSNGANLSWPMEYQLPDDDPTNPNYFRNLWLVGAVNAAPYIASALLGCWLSDPSNNLVGRRGTIFSSGIFCLLAPIGSGLSRNWWELFICRILLGIGMGLKGSTIPIYAAENVPAMIRGGLVMSWQLWTAFGIFLGFVANVSVYRAGDIAWRLQLGSAFIPAIPLVVGVYFCPESPRWLMKKGRYVAAYKSMLRLRNDPIQAARDIYYVHAQLQIEKEITGPSNYLTRFIELFTIPRVRRATLASFVVMLAQQMCGINVVAFYSSSVFVQAGASSLTALLASLGFGAVNFVFAFPAVWTIDTFGRRPLLLFTFPNMAWCLLAAGFCFFIPDTSPARLGLIAFFIFLFAAFYSPGEGPIPFTYSAEVFPLSHREVGMSWAVAICLGFAALLSLTWPRMVAAFTPTGAFGFYAGLNVTALVMIFLWVPETKQRTLEELDYVFAVPTRKHMSYQVNQSLPFFFKRWVKLDKTARLEPLYQLDHVQADAKRSASVTSEKA